MKGARLWDSPNTFFEGRTALIVIFSPRTKIKQGTENDRETRFILNPCKPLLNKRSLTMNPAYWNKCKQGTDTHSCTNTHSQTWDTKENKMKVKKENTTVASQSYIDYCSSLQGCKWRKSLVLDNTEDLLVHLWWASNLCLCFQDF